MDRKTLVSLTNDPYLNQAIESTLFFNSEASFVLFLYVNEPSVVIGRNQNPWKELSLTKETDIKYLRRISGGGTVYHDLKNLNFAFIYSEGMTTVDDNLKLIVKSLKSFGINLDITERKDLFYKDKKVSGNAFYRRGKKRLHHGTLLIDVKTSDLWQVLNFDHDRYKCRSIPSVKSEIVNMNTINQEITVSKVRESIEKTFEGKDICYTTFIKQHTLELDRFRCKYSGTAWLYEETPYFEYTYSNDLYKVKNGYIVESNNTKLLYQLFDINRIKKEVENVTRVI